MSSKRRLRRNACTGKARHETSEAAAIQMRKSHGHHLSVYRCAFCGSFHIGNPKGTGPRPS